MTNRSKHLPYYVILFGCICMSVGFNFIQYEEIKLLRQEKVIYKVFFEYLYFKLEKMEKDQKDRNLVYE